MKLSVNGKIIIAVLCCVLLVGVIGWMTTGFTDFTKESVADKFASEVNEKNFHQPENCSLKSSNDGDGIVVTVNKDGSVELDGQNTSKTTDKTYTIGTVTLDKGTYTFTALKGASKAKAYVTLEYAKGSEVTIINADFTGNTFEIPSDATVCTLKVTIRPEVEINATVLPVIIPGEEAGAYYA